MQNRFATLREHLQTSHLPLVIEYREERYPILVNRSMTVRELREQIVAKLVQDTGFKSDYALFHERRRLALDDVLESLPVDALIEFRRVERQQELDDVVLWLGFEGGVILTIDKVPAVIGRSRDEDTRGVEVNLQDFENSLTVSRRHAEVFRQGGQFYIRNLSDKVLMVNEASVAAGAFTEIHDGDEIRLGRIAFRLRIQPKQN